MCTNQANSNRNTLGVRIQGSRGRKSDVGRDTIASTDGAKRRVGGLTLETDAAVNQQEQYHSVEYILDDKNTRERTPLAAASARGKHEEFGWALFRRFHYNLALI